MGRAAWAAMAHTTDSVKAPPWPEVPIRMVGRALRTTSASLMPLTVGSRFQPATSLAGLA